jgi:hypothetical protein
LFGTKNPHAALPNGLMSQFAPGPGTMGKKVGPVYVVPSMTLRNRPVEVLGIGMLRWPL